MSKYEKENNTDSSTPFINNGNCSSSNDTTNVNIHNNNSSNNINNLTNRRSMAFGTSSSSAANGDSECAKNTNKDTGNLNQMKETIARLQFWLLLVTGIAVAGFVILIVVVTVLYVTLNYNLTHHTHSPKVGQQIAAILAREELCLPCEDFTIGPSDEEKAMLKKFSRIDGEDNTKKCCVDKPVELVELLKLYVERRFRMEISRGTLNLQRWPKESNVASSRKPAAHLMMAQQDLRDIDQIPGRQYTIGHWIHNDDLAFTKETTYRHGRIVIPMDGFYFVYSQISFMETFDLHTSQGHGSRHSADVPSLSHYLFRYNLNYHNGGEEKLAQNSITKCWGQSKTFGEYVSNLGAVFFLRNGDEIFVKVSNLTMVSTEAKLSYFGLFKI